MAMKRRNSARVLASARKVPSIPMQRRMQLDDLVAARRSWPRPASWCAIFLKAYAIVSADRAELRRTYMPFPWPHGFKTMPELEQKQGGGGTRPKEFESDKKELRDLTERFAKLPLDFSWPQHPYFGAMSYGEWMRLAFLHADHHLRQFSA